MRHIGEAGGRGVQQGISTVANGSIECVCKHFPRAFSSRVRVENSASKEGEREDDSDREGWDAGRLSRKRVSPENLSKRESPPPYSLISVRPRPSLFPSPPFARVREELLKLRKSNSERTNDE